MDNYSTLHRQTISRYSKRAAALLIALVMTLLYIPGGAMSTDVMAADAVSKTTIPGFGDVYYVVGPSNIEPASSMEPEHTHINVPGKGNQDAYRAGSSDVFYYTAEDIPSTFYGSSSMTWLEFWRNEGIDANTLTDASSPNRDSEGAGHGGVAGGYLDLGGFDAVTRPTVVYGIAHFTFQYTTILNGFRETEQTAATGELDYASVSLAQRSSGYVYDDALTNFTKGNDTDSATSFTLDGKTYTMDDYNVTGFQRIPVKVDGFTYIETMTQLAAGKSAPASGILRSVARMDRIQW